MDLNNQASSNNTPILSPSKLQAQRKNILDDETPLSGRTRSRVSTQFLIQYDQKQSQLNMMRNQHIEENKQKFSEMMDLPFVVRNNDFRRRGKTFQVFKKIELIKDDYQNDKLQNIVLKRTTPLQEIETNKKLSNVFFRKKKLRQTGTLYSCELWSRPYYDHIMNKSELKQMHLKVQESSKCKNYDQRINDLHKLFVNWQKKQPNLVNPSDYIVSSNNQFKNDEGNDNESDKDQNDQYDQIEETFYSSKKSKFFKPSYTEPDQQSEDSFIENIPHKKSDQREGQSFTSRTYDQTHQNDTTKKYYVSSQITPSLQKKNIYKINSMSLQTKNNSIFSLPQSVTENKKIILSNANSSKGSLTERFDRRKRCLEQNTTTSTNIVEQSTFIVDNVGNKFEDKLQNKTQYKLDDKFLNKTQNKLDDRSEIKTQNKQDDKSLNNQQNAFHQKYKSKIKQIFNKECNFLIKDCAQYQKDSVKIQKEISYYMNKQQQEQQDEINKKNLSRQKEDFSSFLIKQLK